MMPASDPVPFAGETGVRNAPAIVMRCAFIMYLREEYPASEIIRIENRRYRNRIYFSETAGFLCLDRKDPRFYHIDIEKANEKRFESVQPACSLQNHSELPNE